MATGLELVTDAFTERNVFSVGDTIPSADSTYAISLANRIIDAWNARGVTAFSTDISTHVMTANLQPHLIGPSGTTNFVVTPRPMKIEGANLVVGSGTSAVRYPITIRDRQWWLALSTPGVTSTIPTDLYYDPTVTNGSIYLSPIPSSAGTLELQIRRPLVAITSGGTYALPPGYQDALTLTIAERLPVGFGPVPPDLPRQASLARGVIFGANVKAPRLATHDAGMPGGGGGYFNWLSGTNQ